MKMNKKLLIILCISSIIMIILDIYVINYAGKENKTMQKATKTNTTHSLDNHFYYEDITEQLAQKINGKSYKPNNDIAITQLKHVVVQYIDFSNNTQTGELIVNEKIAQDTVDIFKELYLASYPIEKIKLIDEYDANDELSMEDNNTSCFNYRTVDGKTTLSDHSYGLAIDINPLYNPYVRTDMGDRNVLPVNGTAYADRSISFPYKIIKNDVCYNAFVSRGFKWGGEWNSPIDYQHFYKEF